VGEEEGKRGWNRILFFFENEQRGGESGESDVCCSLGKKLV